MTRRYHPDVDDASELYAEGRRKRHIDGPDCECRGCMADDDESNGGESCDQE